MGKVCVCGASALEIDYGKRILKVAGRVFGEGEFLSIDGTAGTVHAGEVKTAPSEVIQGLIHGNAEARQGRTYRNFTQLMKWCAQATRMAVRTNADTPEQTRNAVAFGATGIGLTRTEHMFFEGSRIDAMREMILADNLAAREKALAKLLPYQREDFLGIFKALKGFPATIRFLDPPLHEFLPNAKEQQAALAKKLGIAVEKGDRAPGARAARVQSDAGLPRLPPRDQVPGNHRHAGARRVRGRRPGEEAGHQGEPRDHDPLGRLQEGARSAGRGRPRRRRQGAGRAGRSSSPTLVGDHRSRSRAARSTADEIDHTAEIFSFGTNDLTQTALGISRDDLGSFLGAYQEADIMKKNPFATIDQSGVGQLMRIAIQKGRATRPDIKLGICGEHGGDPDSVKFCHQLGLSYVSCSPFRVPVARLAAAQAAVAEQAAKK